MGLVLENTGQSPLKFEVKRFVVTLNERSIPPRFETTYGYLYPGMHKVFRYNAFQGVCLAPFIIGGRVEYDIEYFPYPPKKSPNRYILRGALAYNASSQDARIQPISITYTFSREEQT